MAKSRKGMNRRIKRGPNRRTSRTTTRRRRQRGGTNGALVGAPIGADQSTWPGNAANHGGNHIPLNTYENTPFQHLQATQGGGRRRTLRRTNVGSSLRKRRGSKGRKQRGGGSFFSSFFPETSLMGENISHSLGSAMNTYKGYQAPVDPKPWLHPELLKVQQRMI